MIPLARHFDPDEAPEHGDDCTTRPCDDCRDAQAWDDGDEQQAWAMDEGVE